MEMQESQILQVEIDGQQCAIPIEVIGIYMRLLGSSSIDETVHMMGVMQDPGILDPQSSANAFTSAFAQVRHDMLNDYNQTLTAARIRATDPETGRLIPDGRARTRELLGLDGVPVSQYEEDQAAAAAQAVGYAAATPRKLRKATPIEDRLGDLAIKVHESAERFDREMVSQFLSNDHGG